MDDSLTDELVTGIGRFLDKEMTADRLRGAAGLDNDEAKVLLEGVIELGWPLVLLSEEEGGLGGGLPQVAALSKMVGRHLSSLPLQDLLVSPVLTHSAVSADDLTVLAIASSDTFGRIGWDPWAPMIIRDGRISATRTMIAFADCASSLLVTGVDGSVPFIGKVQMSSATLRRLNTVDPTSRLFSASFEEAPVEVLARHDAAIRRCDEAFRVLRLACAAEVSGICRHVTELAVDYAKTRHQFNVPIGSFQAVKHLLAEMMVASYSLDALVDAASNPDATSLSGCDGVKVQSSRTGRWAMETALQVFGGIGFTDEHSLSLYFKRVIALEGLWGDSGELEYALGHRLLGEGDGG